MTGPTLKKKKSFIIDEYRTAVIFNRWVPFLIVINAESYSLTYDIDSVYFWSAACPIITTML